MADDGGNGLGLSLESVKGIGPKRAAQLARHGLQSVGDLLYHLPFRYEDRRTLKPIGDLTSGAQATTVAEIVRVRDGGRFWRAPGGQRPRPGRVLEAEVRDASGAATLVWFHQTAGVRARLRPGARVVIHGRVEPGPKFVHPEIEVLPEPTDETVAVGRIVPVYTKPMGMPGGVIRRLVQSALSDFSNGVRDALPPDVMARHGLMSLEDALEYLHRPPRDADIEALNRAETGAHRTVIFDELFCLQVAMLVRRARGVAAAGIAFAAPSPRVAALRRALPFALTNAQQRVVAEIFAGMAGPQPMRRLVQGDVGSGKTVVALFAALVALDAGYSAAVMAPTEVLAEQHAETMSTLLAPLGVTPVVLTGAVKGGERAAALAAAASGEPVLLIGTHALIQQQVRFANLGLAIVDEQHRFGVEQRRRLQRGARGGAAGCLPPDALVMTATPIPRTLAMTVYGDLDVSFLDELPPGRQPVRTRVLTEADRERAYAFARQELARGRQAFVVFPLVEESEGAPVRAASAMVAELRRTAFAGHAVGLLHGRMRSDEKDDVMRRFKAGALDALVCTTVIEVGIDVPGANVMVIEHADRFGLAQLHQLRGRVGRGTDAATCLLIASEAAAGRGLARLRTLEEAHDGGTVAEADLRMRGPGEFLGTRQAGLPELRVASLLRDAEVLATVRGEAERFVRDLGGEQKTALETVRRYPWADRLLG